MYLLYIVGIYITVIKNGDGRVLLCYCWYDIYFWLRKWLRHALHSSSGVSRSQSDAPSLISTKFFSPMLQDVHKALTIVQALSKNPNMSSAMVTHPCWQKAFSFKRHSQTHVHTTSGLCRTQRASWYIHCTHACKIMIWCCLGI